MNHDSPIHIVYIIDDLKVGGAQVHLVRLVDLMRQSFSLEIICLGPRSEKLMAQFTNDVEVIFFDMSSIRRPAMFLSSFFGLIRHLRCSKPQLVHTYLNTANVFGLLAARLAGIRRVITSRRDMGYFRTGRMAAVESWLSRHVAQEVFCVCQAVAEATKVQEKIPFKKLRVLLNGIDTMRYQPKTKETSKTNVVFSMVAAMNREMKGHSDLLKAIAEAVTSQQHDFLFQLVGDGPLRDSLEAEVRHLDIGKYVQFVGEQSDVMPILMETDVLVVPSHTEGISNAVLEAMATGLPVIATAVDGNREVLVDNVNGFLVPFQNPEAMAKAILMYTANKPMIRMHGDNARKHVEENFSLQLMQDNYIAAYQEVLQ